MKLTREQIEAMADAEVDRYIAEKVMGWGTWRTSAVELGWRTCAEKNVRLEDWHPAVNLNQAIEAAEKVGLEKHVQDKSWAESWVAGFALAWGGEEWEAGWQTSGPEGTDWYDPWMGYSKNHARAVCNAVIAAHEDSKPDVPAVT
jgi:hypothetical protein